MISDPKMDPLNYNSYLFGLSFWSARLSGDPEGAVYELAKRTQTMQQAAQKF